MTLSYLGMQEYTFHAPRVTLISANKEGLISLTGILVSHTPPFDLLLILHFSGYLAVHILGLSAGALILPPSPKYFSRVLKERGPALQSGKATTTSRGVSLAAPRQNDKTAIELFSYSVIWWILFGISRWLGIGGEGVSRRMVYLSLPLLPCLILILIVAR